MAFVVSEMFEDPAVPTQPVIDEHADASERTYAMFMHLTLLLTSAMIPVIPALIMWTIKRKDSPFLDDHGKEAMNFQISLLLYSIVIVPIIGVLTCSIGFFILWPVVVVLGVVGMIMAAVAANKGQYFRYPACIRFIH